MTDIVERLRGPANELMDEAAAEIERLQFQVEIGKNLTAEIEKLTRERDEVSLLAVNRLIEIDRVRARYDSATDQAVRYADDNERLTAALTKIRSVVGTSTEAWLIANRALEQKP